MSIVNCIVSRKYPKRAKFCLDSSTIVCYTSFSFPGNTGRKKEEHTTVAHPMTKDHFISFLAFLTSDRLQLVKLYPEGNAETRLQLRGMGYLYAYCNRHGLFRLKYPLRKL